MYNSWKKFIETASSVSEQLRQNFQGPGLTGWDVAIICSAPFNRWYTVLPPNVCPQHIVSTCRQGHLIHTLAPQVHLCFDGSLLTDSPNVPWFCCKWGTFNSGFICFIMKTNYYRKLSLWILGTSSWTICILKKHFKPSSVLATSPVSSL